MPRRILHLADAVSIKHGFAYEGKHFSNSGPGPVLVTPGNFAVGGGWKSSGKARYYLGPEPAGYRLKRGDLVVTMTDLSKTGDTLGYPAIVPGGAIYLHNQRIGLVTVKDDNRLDPGFLSYLLRGPSYRDHVLATCTGSTVRHTSPGRILAFVSKVPSVGEQRAIAEVLGALDDKIEANRRTQDIAERLARSELLGAQADARSSLASVGSLVERIGVIVRPDELQGGGAYIGLEHMPRGSVVLKEYGDAKGLASSKAVFQPKDVLFGKLRPYFKKVAVAPTNGVCSTDILVLRPRDGNWAFAVTILSSNEVIEYASAGSEGTRMPRVSWDYLSRCTVALPARRPELEARIAPLLELAMSLTVESEDLISLRDKLLPKLLSGEVRVRDADDLVGEAV